jgi:beta-glucosidase
MRHQFLFGAATASHQVEGGTHNDWTEWERQKAKQFAALAVSKKWPDHILNGFPNPLQEENYISGRACDHYRRFREDFDIARSLGHTAHRFSIEWSRIEPEEGKFDEGEIAHYGEVVAALRERGMEPFVTLWHYTLPVWLAEKGGVMNEKFSEYFARYAERMAVALKDVSFWITINEPEIVAIYGYVRGTRPPEKRGIWGFYLSMSRIIRAHRAAYRSIKRTTPESRVGAAIHMSWFESAGGWVNDLLKYLVDRFGNFYFLNRTVAYSDFIGFNHYAHNRINWGFNKNENKETTDVGWEIYPESIYQVLKQLQKYHMPIYITENGLADARDAQREQFIDRYLACVKRAVNEGVDVRGYLHWSLLDNFEWDSGFWPRFGLVEIDYRTLERKVRPSALAYKKIIETWHEQ